MPSEVKTPDQIKNPAGLASLAWHGWRACCVFAFFSLAISGHASWTKEQDTETSFYVRTHQTSGGDSWADLTYGGAANTDWFFIDLSAQPINQPMPMAWGQAAIDLAYATDPTPPPAPVFFDWTQGGFYQPPSWLSAQSLEPRVFPDSWVAAWTPAAVPEPTIFLLFLIGAALLRGRVGCKALACLFLLSMPCQSRAAWTIVQDSAVQQTLTWQTDQGFTTLTHYFSNQQGAWVWQYQAGLGQLGLDEAFTVDGSMLPSPVNVSPVNSGLVWPTSWGNQLFGAGGCTGCSPLTSEPDLSASTESATVIASVLKAIFFLILGPALLIGLTIFGFRLSRKVAT